MHKLLPMWYDAPSVDWQLSPAVAQWMENVSHFVFNLWLTRKAATSFCYNRLKLHNNSTTKVSIVDHVVLLWVPVHIVQRSQEHCRDGLTCLHGESVCLLLLTAYLSLLECTLAHTHTQHGCYDLSPYIIYMQFKVYRSRYLTTNVASIVF